MNGSPSHSVASYDHPHHARLEDAITIDFVNQTLRPTARAADVADRRPIMPPRPRHARPDLRLPAPAGASNRASAARSWHR